MKLFGIARLGRDVEIRHTASGKQVASLALAYDYGMKDENGKKPTQWVSASLWGDQAGRLQQYLTKGTALLVTLRDVHIEPGNGDYGPKLVGTVADVEFVPKQRDSNTAPESCATEADAGTEKPPVLTTTTYRFDRRHASRFRPPHRP